ncbi:hypothetical protein C0J52_27883, partial [Blattella germanica]
NTLGLVVESNRSDSYHVVKYFKNVRLFIRASRAFVTRHRRLFLGELSLVPTPPRESPKKRPLRALCRSSFIPTDF